MSTTILVSCPSCRGTGVYRGFAEPPGVGVVCLKCSGTGAASLTYEPFAGRAPRHPSRVAYSTPLEAWR